MKLLTLLNFYKIINLLNKAERFANICKSNATNTSNDTVLYKDTVLEAFRPFLRAYLLDIFKIHLTLQDKIEYYGHRGTIKYIGKSVIEKVFDFGEKIHEFIDTGNNKNVSTNVNTSGATTAVTTTTTTYSNNHKPYKTTEIRNEHNKCYGEIREETIKTHIKFRLNKHYPITIIEYRSLSLPDKIIPG